MNNSLQPSNFDLLSELIIDSNFVKESYLQGDEKLEFKELKKVFTSFGEFTAEFLKVLKIKQDNLQLALEKCES